MKGYIRLILVAGLLSFSATGQAKEMIQIKGSDTLINLVQKLSEVYMQKNPGKYLSVTGGGSGTGIAALINRKCDIADASRQIKGSEVEQAVAAGINPKRVIVAVDGLSIIVNANNSVKQLTFDQVGKIYRGEIFNWKELGGDDEPVTLYGRQPNSGTYDFMKEVVMKGDYSPRMMQMNGNAQIIEGVRSDKGSIGYVGVGYVKNATGIAVINIARSAGSPYLSPLNTDDVVSGRYPISRPLNQYLAKVTPDIVDFIRFELSPEGQKIVQDEGFFTLPPEYVESNQAVLGK
ncbi:MAG: PstS family phosphate ABC transporter substrate-binding protein [Candidatus Omnitrophica bacterium]|nr:PstS family phosphate ABC transporter substrate-binding protein [Candidatus Omnitrophota bacterium]